MTKIINERNIGGKNSAKTGVVAVNSYNLDPTTVTAAPTAATLTRAKLNQYDYWKVTQTSAATDEFDLPDVADVGEVINLYAVASFELNTQTASDTINNSASTGYQATLGDLIKCTKVSSTGWLVVNTPKAGAVGSGSSGFSIDPNVIAATVAGVWASQTLTVSSTIVEGVHASNTLTASTILTTETVTIDSTVYRFMTTPVQAFDVNLGANDAAALDNFKVAVNASGTGDGSDYYAGTTAHPTVVATTNGATTQVVVAKLQGTASNAEATTDTGGGSSLTWADSTLGGGTGASIVGVAGDTVTIDTVTYTFVDILSEDNTDAEDLAVINQVHWVTNDATALDNLKLAINAGATEGTNYSTGTVVHPSVTAETNGATTQIVQARIEGSVSNAIVTTAVAADGLSWGAATLAGGTDHVVATPSAAELAVYNYWNVTSAGATYEFDLPDAANIGDVLTFYFAAQTELRTETETDKINEDASVGYTTAVKDLFTCTKMSATEWIVTCLTVAGVVKTINATIAPETI